MTPEPATREMLAGALEAVAQEINGLLARRDLPRAVREALGQVEAVCRYQHDVRSDHRQCEVAARLRKLDAGA